MSFTELAVGREQLGPVQPMLTHLVIKNFAIIEHLEIPLREGYTVFTGETGAGKSIIVDALNLILGGRASTEVIRTDEEEATVEGSFEPGAAHLDRIRAILKDQGIDAEEDQLVVRRRVRHNGRNKVFINGSLSTVSTLREVTRGLVDISGQHEHYSLLSVDGHVDIVDQFAELEDLREEMEEAWKRVREIRADLEQLQGDVRERLNRLDFLEYQLSEIEDAALEPGEEEELEEEFQRLKHAEEIGESARRALELGYEGDDSAVERLSAALRHLREAAEHDESLQPLADRLDEARIETEELALELQDYLRGIEVDPERLDAVVERLDSIGRLQRKHDVSSVEELLDRAEQMREEIERLRNAEARTEELERELEEAEREAFGVARRLSAERRESAEQLRERIEDVLEDLHMGETRFRVDFDPAELPEADAELRDRLGPSDGDSSDGQTSLLESLTLDSRGFDDVEFLIAPNVGEEPRPLANIASGGELSRVMLAIKSVLTRRDSVETYVFDEVDAGIGGTTADVVGGKIARIADSHQIVCITHLAQIASRGDHHYHVEKTERGGRTHSTVEALDAGERVDEIARMLAGTNVTGNTRDAARELLGDEAA